MCIVIDTNTLSPVFNLADQEHPEFRPVLKWICKGKGKVVYGGTKYKEELKSTKKYLRFFRHLDAARKVVRINDRLVDKAQKEVDAQLHHRDFDDAHLIAIVIVSGCKLVCSRDARAYPFLKDKDLYPKHVERPYIYSRAKNAHLLCDENIAKCCEPAVRKPNLCDIFAT